MLPVGAEGEQTNTLFSLRSGWKQRYIVSTANEKTSPSGPASIALLRFSTVMYLGLPVLASVVAPASNKVHGVAQDCAAF